MGSDKNVGECPNCGQEVALRWYDDGTHSQRLDISEYEYLDICYSVAESAEYVDAYVHVFNDPDKVKG